MVNHMCDLTYPFIGSLVKSMKAYDHFIHRDGAVILPFAFCPLLRVIGELKLEMDQCQSGGGDDCVLKEFIPLETRSNGYKEEKEAINLEEVSKEKMGWMSSAQLWSDNLSYESINCKEDSEEKKDEGSHNRRDYDVLSLESKSGLAFLPFKAVPGPRKEEEKLSISLSNLSFVPLPTKVPYSAPIAVATEEDNHSSGLNSKAVTIASSSTGNDQLACCHNSSISSIRRGKHGSASHRNLHRRFIITLQKLGGAQVTTPKQIRELMKVDGLTIDEVKSHLQHVDQHVYVSSKEVQVKPVEAKSSERYMLFIVRNLVSYPKWVEIDLFFNGP
ncbi:hypothetical protein KFK09_011727 [Dendrobium nobile]|uniref:HTH myb-type domain-containing protein n=1 Tax=Dendrobium nobile TaxID=94219 RepID=A0A8T3BGT2_DENNO|nr:hypothetical protein KFK09_011727 [Dendrobium nobile]